MCSREGGGVRAVAVYCGASDGRNAVYLEAARTLGAELARRGITLVYGGGRVGLMGALADAVLAHGGQVVGVMPDFLVRREVAHPGLTELRIVTTMHERKAAMAQLADAFIVLPGGLGTFEEFFETLTWTQLGLHDKAHGLLDTNDFFAPLLDLLSHIRREGFMRDRAQALVQVSSDVASLLDALSQHEPRDHGAMGRA